MASLGLIRVIKLRFRAIPKWWALQFWWVCSHTPRPPIYWQAKKRPGSTVVLEHGGKVERRGQRVEGEGQGGLERWGRSCCEEPLPTPSYLLTHLCSPSSSLSLPFPLNIPQRLQDCRASQPLLWLPVSWVFFVCFGVFFVFFQWGCQNRGAHHFSWIPHFFAGPIWNCGFHENCTITILEGPYLSESLPGVAFTNISGVRDVSPGRLFPLFYTLGMKLCAHCHFDVYGKQRRILICNPSWKSTDLDILWSMYLSDEETKNS